MPGYLAELHQRFAVLDQQMGAPQEAKQGRWWSGGAEGRVRVYTEQTNAECPPGLTMSTSTQLHLPDLVIQGFRGIDDLTIPRLGRVTLLVGRNSVGKTTVLEAAQIYAARGRRSVLDSILRNHDETSAEIDGDGDHVSGPDWPALFHERRWSAGVEAVIGPTNERNQLKLGVGPLTEGDQGVIWDWLPDSFVDEFLEANPQVLRAKFRNRTGIIGISTGFTAGATPRVLSWNPRTRSGSWRRPPFADEDAFAPPIICERVGPGLLSNTEIARYLDQVALSEAQQQAVDALRLIFGSQVEDIAIVGRERRAYAGDLRTIVKLRGYDRAVPLRSLGDGALRLFGVALALANSRGGFLLLDEVENGIHYSLHGEFWRMVLLAAKRTDVQVIATTHSGDCSNGFAFAVAEIDDADGLLVRIQRDDDGLRAVGYSEEGLKGAAMQHIEVR